MASSARPTRRLHAVLAAAALTAALPASTLGEHGHPNPTTPYVVLEAAAAGGTVVPLINSGQTFDGTTFEGIPDGIGVVPVSATEIDLYVTFEQSHVPFQGFADFEDSSIQRARIDLSERQLTQLEEVLPSSAGFIRFCSAFMAGPQHGFSHYTFFANEESNDIIDVPEGGPYGADPSVAPYRQAGYSVFLNTSTGEYGQVSRMGRLNHENTIFVPGGWKQMVSLTTDDADALAADARLLVAVVPELQRSLQIKYGNLNFNMNVLGTTPNYVPVRNYTVTYGRMFTKGDDDSRQRYAVVGSAVPTMLNANPAALINQTILIRGQPFAVLGVLSEKGSQGSFENPDERILVPLTTARYRLFGTDRLRSIAVKVRDGVPLQQGMVDIERVLRREHKIRPGGDNDFQIRNQQDILATQQQTTETFKMLLGSIAAVSLLVGGIGIMNIMLASILERTREIGVRRALGARQKDIIRQFLIEATLISFVGGVMGIAFGFGISYLISWLAGWVTIVTPISVIVAFVVSASVGLLFGIYPAMKAARLDPVEAIRYE